MQSTNRIIISKEETTVKPQDEIAVSNVGNENVKDDLPEDPDKNIPQEKVSDNNDGNKQNESKTIIDIKEIAPSFPGGENAWLSFLRKHLQSPDELEAGQKINVLVRFWIDIDGNISGLEIIKSGGTAFDKEVLRVMRKMPRWEPAVQIGRRVAVAFTQPVSFVRVEE